MSIVLRCCSGCIVSPSIRTDIRNLGVRGECLACGKNDITLPIEYLRRRFEPLLARYHFGEHAVALGGAVISEPVSLAKRIEDDGILVFDVSLPLDRRNRILDSLLNRPATPAAGHWNSANFGRREWSEDGSDWITFKMAVDRHRRYILNFGENGIPDFRRLIATRNQAFRSIVPAGRILYRARKHDHGDYCKIFSSTELAPPPHQNVTAGRANAAGIRVLYASEDPETAICEVRPHIDARVTVATCCAQRESVVFDMVTRQPVRGCDPFSPEFNQLEKDASLLAELNEEFSRPMTRNTPDRHYAPTQIIAEIAAHAGYAGIRFKSAMKEGGVNYVLFAPEDFAYARLRWVSITAVHYDFVEAPEESFDALLRFVPS